MVRHQEWCAHNFHRTEEKCPYCEIERLKNEMTKTPQRVVIQNKEGKLFETVLPAMEQTPEALLIDNQIFVLHTQNGSQRYLPANVVFPVAPQYVTEMPDKTKLEKKVEEVCQQMDRESAVLITSEKMADYERAADKQLDAMRLTSTDLRPNTLYDIALAPTAEPIEVCKTCDYAVDEKGLCSELCEQLTTH